MPSKAAPAPARVVRKSSKQQRKASVQVLLLELKACSRTRDLRRGQYVHAEAAKCGHDSNIYVATALVDMYVKCGRMVEAHQIFDRIEQANVVSWNVLILGYAEKGQGAHSLQLFKRLSTAGLAPDSATFVAALKACSSLAVEGGAGACRERGRELHNLAVENCCDANIYVQNTLIDMYAKCGSIADARQVFDRMRHPDVVSWNALIQGYADAGQGFTALDLFEKMKAGGLAIDSLTFLAALKACISVAKEGSCEPAECRLRGKEIHELVVSSGFFSELKLQNTLIDMYSKCSSMLDASQVFESMKHTNVVSWTALILGYADNGQGLTALDLFTRMRNAGPAPNSVTFTAALKACSLVGGLEIGRTIHSGINRRDYDVVLVNCLVDFYVKCGSLVEAKSVFDDHADRRNVVTWTTLLAGLSRCGAQERVLPLLKAMFEAGFAPNAVTFLCILTCCSHAGLVEEGKACFDEMPTKYAIVPAVEHYNCMVDAFGRANKLDEAMALIEYMPCSPDNVTWMTILDACRKWKNVEVGRIAFQSLINFDDGDAPAYVLMGQIYGSRGMLQEQEMVMSLRRRALRSRTNLLC